MNEFPDDGKPKEDILKRIRSAKEENINFSSGRVFGSMCTEPLEIGREVHEMFIESNLGNPGLYKGTKELEEEVHRAVGSLLHAQGCTKFSVGGGTEGNILGLWNARDRTGKKKVLLPKSAHFSFKKACDLLQMKPDFVPLNDDYRMDIDVLREKVDEETAAVVGIAGTTELGMVDDIEEIADIPLISNGDVHLHVDAAFGGMVIPFLREGGKNLPRFDFSIQSVDSLVVDPHKMGFSPTPLGLFFSREDISTSIEAPYLTGDEHKTIRGTRSSASIPAFWATIQYLGREGYRKKIEQCMENTFYLKERMEEIGFESITEPVMNIVSFHHPEPKSFVKKMMEKGGNVSRTLTPPGIRFVVMPHVTEDAIDGLIDELSDME